MRKYLALLLAAIFWASAVNAPARAWYADGGGDLQGYWVSTADVESGLNVSFLQCNSQVFPDDVTVTLSGLNVGAEAADRVTVLGIVAKDATAGHNFTSVTVGGVAATEVADEAATGEVNSAILIMNNPSGTAEDVTVTISQSSNDAVTVCLWRVTGLTNLTPKATTVDDDTASGPLVLNLADTHVTGFAVGVCIAASDAGATTTWTGLTELTDATDADGSATYSAAHATSTDGNALTVGCDWTGATDASGAVAAFGTSPPVTVTFLQCHNDPDSIQNYTITSANVGTASADRLTVIGIGTRDTATSFNVTSVTIGGTAATELTDNAGAGLVSAAFYSLRNTAGTAEDIVINNSEALASLQVCVWQVNNAGAVTASDSATVFDTNSGAIVLDTDVPADGVALGFCTVQDATATTSWSALTERSDGSVGAGEDHASSSADYDEDASASTPLSITATISLTFDASCSVVSFAP